MSENEKVDSRILCRYGAKCYQKNPIHLSKYKHPRKDSKRKYNLKVQPVKKIKLSEDETNQTESDHSDQEQVIEENKKKECLSSSDSEQDSDELKNDAKTTNSDNEEADNSEEQESLFNPKKCIKSRFLLDPPDDFYKLWDFCKKLKPTAPNEALKDVGLELVGPYDVLAGKFKNVKKSPEEYLRHWRYYYDPPEVLTVLKGDQNSGFHIGYFYDSPEEASFLVGNHGSKDGVFSKMGDNIFCAINLYLEDLKKSGDPFKKMRIGKFSISIKTEAEKLELDLSPQSLKIKERRFKVVTKTFNKIGLVVPYNKKSQLGYRDLAMLDKDLMVLLTKLQKAAPEQRSKYLSDLQPVLTYANIALDECDFGTGVKLGWELLFHGIDSLDSTISQFLGNSYRLLGKEAFAKIAEAHMKKRKKGSDLSII